MGRQKLFLLLLVLPLALCSRANEGKAEGVLNGQVTDAITKKPVAGVLVSAILPGVNGSKEVTTDAEGYFRFAQLPALQITIQFDKKGYLPYKRPAVLVKEKMSVRLNIEFSPEDAGADDPASPEYPLLRMVQAN